jgi:hypothetical protein
MLASGDHRASFGVSDSGPIAGGAGSSAKLAGGILIAGLVACSNRLAPAESEHHKKTRSRQHLPSRKPTGAATQRLRQ